MADNNAPDTTNQPAAGQPDPGKPADGKPPEPQTPASGGATPPAKPEEGDKTVPYNRFSEVNERAKAAEAELAKIKATQEEADKKKLEDEGKFKELAEKESARAKELEGQITQGKIDNAVIIAAGKAGVADTEAALKLLDRSKIEVEKDGTVKGVEDAVKSLVEAKPYLIDQSNPARVGSPTNPGSPGTEGVKKFKHSQLLDPKFFTENEEEINKALKLGLVEDDL